MKSHRYEEAIFCSNAQGPSIYRTPISAKVITAAESSRRVESNDLFYKDTVHVFSLPLFKLIGLPKQFSRPFHLAIKLKIDARRELQSCLAKNSQTRNATGMETAVY